MRSKIKRITAMILAVVMVFIAAPVMPGSNTVYADTTANIPYDGDDVNAIKADGDGFGMFTPQEGTTCMLDGDNVVIHYVPKNTTTYKGFIWGEISDVPNATDETVQPGVDVELKNGAFDVTLPKSYCGTARAFAPIKNSFGKGSWTSADQYYLAIPAADKLPTKPHDPVDVYVTITNAGEVAVANEAINVADADSDGKITLDDVFVAAHDKWFEGGATAGYANEYNETYQSYSISKFWGVSNGGGYTYYNNNAMCYSLYDEVKEGDHIVAGVFKDLVNWADTYSFFDKFEYEAVGTLTVTLSQMAWDESWNLVTQPCTDADIKLVPVTRAPEDGSYNVVNNGDGTYSLTFHKRGDYKLIASNDAVPLIPAVADLKVNNVAGNGYKFKTKISSQTATNGTGSVTGTVYDNYDAELVFGGTHVNRSNFTLEMWMRNVASLGVDAERYYTRSVETGVTGEDTSMNAVKGLFAPFNTESKVVAKVNGETTMTYTVKNDEAGNVKATADSFDNAHDTWYAIVDEENVKVTHTDEEGDSYIILAKGSWIQAGEQRLDVESELKIDDLGDVEGVKAAIREALALNDADKVDTLEIYLEPGTTLAISSSSVELLKDAKITVDIDGFEESELAAVLEKLDTTTDTEELIKDALAFVGNIADKMGGKTTTVTIDFGHLYPEPGEDEENPVWTWAADYSSATATFTCLNNEEHEPVVVDAVVTSEPNGVRGVKYTATATFNGNDYTDEQFAEDYKFKLEVSSETENNGTGSVTGRVFNDYSAEIVFEGTHISRSNVSFDMWMRNVASLGVDEERHYSTSVDTGLTGPDTQMSVVKSLFSPFNTESKIVAVVDGETTMNYTVKNDENGNVQATPDSFENAHDTWYAIVNEENMEVTHSEEEDDSYLVIAKGSWFQIGDQRIDVTSELKVDNFADLAAAQQAIKSAVALSTADEAVETIEYYLEPGTTLSVSSSKVELLRDAKFTVDIDGYEESGLSSNLTAIQNAPDMETLVKELFDLFEIVTNKMGGKTTTVTIDFDHDWDEATYEWADDNSTVTATLHCNNNDAHDIVETVNTTSTVKTPATCEEKGTTTYTATFEHEEFETQTKDVEDIDALGHLYPAPGEAENNPVWTWADDYSSATVTFTCLRDETHTETFTMTTDPAVTIAKDESDPSKAVYTASVTVNGQTYTDVKEQILDIVVIPYPGDVFTENTDNKDITDDAEYSYTIQGHLVTVSCDLACKIGYLNAAGDAYVAVTDITMVKDNQYTFKVPDDIFEVILVIKGDTSLDDPKYNNLSNYDVTLAKLYNLYPTNNPLTKEQKFAADASDDGFISNYDVTLIKAAIMYMDRALPWIAE